MTVLVLFLQLTFFQDYQHFVDTKKADQLLAQFGRDTTDLAILENDPVKIWFIRNHFPNAAIESLMTTTRPFPRQPEISAVLRWEGSNAPDDAARRAAYLKAYALDPYALDNYLSLVALAVKLKDRPLLKRLARDLFSLLRDFQIQVLVASNLLLGGYFTLVALGFCFVFVALFRYFTLLAHRFGFLSHRFKDIIGAVIVISPVVLLFNVYLLFYIYSLALLFVLSGRVRHWLRLALCMVLLSVPLAYPLTLFSNFLQRRSRTYELYSYLKITYPEAKIQVNRPEEQFIAAYSLKKQKMIEGARALYENLTQFDSDNYALFNNLANVHCLMKNYPAGESLYQKAIGLAPNRGEAHYNLGWCYLKELKFYEASQEIETAKRLGFRPLVEDYYDLPPEESFFWKSLLAEPVRLTLLFRLKFVLPALLLLILSFAVPPFAPPTYCTLCGRPICSKCQQLVGDEVYCGDCWARLSKTRNEKYELSIVDVVQQRQRRWEKFKTLLLTLLLPGLGHVYQGRVVAGSLLAFLPTACYLAYFCGPVIIKPTYWIPLPLQSLVRVAAIPVFVVGYIVAFTSVRSQDVA